MKKTSRTFKRFAAITSASLLAACMVAPMAMTSNAATATDNGNTIIVTPKDGANHTYEAYQIFSGKFSNEKLNDIQWGDGVNNAQLLQELKDNETIGTYFATCVDADDVAGVLTEANGFTNDAEKTKLFSELVAQHLSETKSGTSITNGVTKLPDGYYLLQDSAAPTNPGSNDNSGAKSRYIVRVTAESTVTVDAKHAAPKVDKLVKDEADDKDTNSTDTEGWGETADHAINESFEFKLVATIPENPEFGAYETYKLVFNDTMSEGITFEEISSVTVKGYSGTVAYTPSDVDSDTNSFTITIDNLLTYDNNLKDGATVEVVYKAHLNENAKVNPDSGNIQNQNKVFLQYSNNPNWDGSGTEELGTTKEDIVWVTTYQVLNKKLIGDTETPLPNVPFELKNEDGEKINLTYDSDKNVYYVDPDGSADLKSGTDGTFNIIGLDAGKYILHEVQPLPGYNSCDDVEIEIGAEHSEAIGGDTASVTLTKKTGTNNTIRNYQGSVLPGTGGIGTTVFYLGGGAMVAVAGIYLISKKRMKNTQE